MKTQSDLAKRIPGLMDARFSGHGFKLSPMIGQVMSEIILGQESEIVDVSSLGENRFKEGQ